MKRIHELDVYRLAERLSDMVGSDYDEWPEKAQRTLGYQIIRAGDSIAANIAEEYGRRTAPERKKSYFYARGSFEECKTWLRKAIRRRLVSDVKMAQCKEINDELGPQLNAFIRKHDVRRWTLGAPTQASSVESQRSPPWASPTSKISR
ncbi:MAG: four helix bundle protein [Planctomycetes bacterium]|nr:four helix bundle protein [Planctomycetota bacterium]